MPLQPRTRIHLVASADVPPQRPGHPARDDLRLLALLLLVGLVPFAGVAAGGHWGPGTLGLAAAVTILSGRELGLGVRTFARARR